MIDNSGIEIRACEPPGLKLAAHQLDREVFSCEEAAAAKNIPLENELKTIILDSTLGLLAVHVPGNMGVSLRAVKKFLNCAQAYVASPERLESLGPTPGKVCPILEPVWSLPHLVSEGVLNLEFVSTNNGTLSGFFLFPPQLLLLAKIRSIGQFEKQMSQERW